MTLPSELPISTRTRQFEAIVDRHYSSLWSYVLSLVRTAPDAEDITHQAFLVLFERLATPSKIDDVERWLRGVARNLVRAWWREKRKLPLELADHVLRLADHAADAPSAQLKAEREAVLVDCLKKLSMDERRVIEARYRDGLRVTEIAERERMNVATARVHLFRLRERLKTCVEMRLGAETMP